MADEKKPEKVKIDSVPKGSRDLWPALTLDARTLADQIGEGAHDGYLSELAQMEGAHGRRDVVIDACRRRLPPAPPAKA